MQSSYTIFCLFLVLGYISNIAAETSHLDGLNEDNNEVSHVVRSRFRRADHHCCAYPYDSHSDHGSTDEAPYCILYSDVKGDLQDGSSIEIRHDVSDLEEIGWKQVVSSVQCYGLWILYKQPTFNEPGTGGVGYIFKTEPQFIPFTGELWSHWDDLVVGLRRVGASHNPFTTDSITVYEYKWFSGQHYYADSDIPKLPMRMNDKTASVIITGASDWTIYEHAEFRGRSECLRHEDDNSAAFTTILVLENHVTSIKKGCR